MLQWCSYNKNKRSMRTESTLISQGYTAKVWNNLSHCLDDSTWRVILQITGSVPILEGVQQVLGTRQQPKQTPFDSLFSGLKKQRQGLQLCLSQEKKSKSQVFVSELGGRCCYWAPKLQYNNMCYSMMPDADVGLHHNSVWWVCLLNPGR